jgi:hypothetical protein
MELVRPDFDSSPIVFCMGGLFIVLCCRFHFRLPSRTGSVMCGRIALCTPSIWACDCPLIFMRGSRVYV